MLSVHGIIRILGQWLSAGVNRLFDFWGAQRGDRKSNVCTDKGGGRVGPIHMWDSTYNPVKRRIMYILRYSSGSFV